jgi:hypothetical protein
MSSGISYKTNRRRHRWIRILKEHSKTEFARVIPFEPGSQLEKVLRRRALLGPEARLEQHEDQNVQVG